MFVASIAAPDTQFPGATGFSERSHTCEPIAACEVRSQPAISSCADSPPFPSRKLAEINFEAAELVKLCFFVAFIREQVAKELGVSVSTVERRRAYARAWLFRAIRNPSPHFP